MQRLFDALNSTLLAVRFFSRLPVDRFLPAQWRDEPPKLSDHVVGFPTAGLIIAVIPAIVWLIAVWFLPAPLAAGLAVLAGLIVTGGLHEDGLADCVDGLGGSSDRERALEIMRDGSTGPYGVAALIFSIGLRWAALASLSPTLGVAALMIAHCGGRAAIAPVLFTSAYARETGLGEAVRGDISSEHLIIVLALTAGVAFAFGLSPGLIATIAGFGAAWAMLVWQERRLGGYTGDGLGAIEQVAEITILLVLAGIWR